MKIEFENGSTIESINGDITRSKRGNDYLLKQNEEYKKYVEAMKEIYLRSHKTLEGFDEWFEISQELCELLCD